MLEWIQPSDTKHCPQKKNDKAELSTSYSYQNICIFISQLDMVVSVLRVIEETPGEETIAVSKHRML